MTALNQSKILAFLLPLLGLGSGSITSVARDHDGKPGAETAESEVAVAQTLLEERGLDTNPEALMEFLRRLGIEEEEHEELAKMVLHLGASKFAKRRQAQLYLSKRAFQARPHLLEHKTHPDPEVRTRIREILEGYDFDQTGTDIQNAAVVLTTRPTRKLIEVLMRLQPSADRWTRSYLTRLMHEMVKPEDEALIEAYRRHALLPIRETAIVVSQRFLKPGETESLFKLLVDDNPRIRFAAAKALGNAGDRRCLPALLALMNPNDKAFFQEVEGALTSLTGHHVAADTREEKWAVWSQWIEKNEGDAELSAAFVYFNEALLRRGSWRVVPGPESALSKSTWIFLPGGKLKRINSNNKEFVKDTWSLQGAELVVVINNYATYRGRYAQSNRISGTATNIKNKRWTWYCERIVPGKKEKRKQGQ